MSPGLRAIGNLHSASLLMRPLKSPLPRRFEGLAREYIPHGKGVMTFGTGTGGGLQTVNPGDKYELLCL